MAKKNQTEDGIGVVPFQGYSSPRYTMVPDELFDEQLAYLSGAELKVLLYIIRRTFGFKRDQDNISLHQICSGITTRDGRVLDHGTGLSVSTVVQALKGLVAKNAIIPTRRSSPEKGDEPTTYSLKFVTSPISKIESGGSSKIEDGGSSIFGEGGLRKSKTQETVVQETGKQETEYSSGEKATVSSSSNREGGPGGEVTCQTPVVATQPAANISLAAPQDDPPTPTMLSEHQDSTEPEEGSSPRRGFTRIGDTLTQRRATGPEKMVQRPSAGPQAALSPKGDAHSLSARQTALSGISTPASPRLERRPRLPRTDYLDTVIAEFSAEFHDEEHVRSNLAQARNLLVAAGIEEDQLVGKCYEARSLTRDRGNISRYAGDSEALRNKMPYFFACLRDVLGMREDEGGPRPPLHPSSP